MVLEDNLPCCPDLLRYSSKFFFGHVWLINQHHLLTNATRESWSSMSTQVNHVAHLLLSPYGNLERENFYILVLHPFKNRKRKKPLLLQPFPVQSGRSPSLWRARFPFPSCDDGSAFAQACSSTAKQAPSIGFFRKWTLTAAPVPVLQHLPLFAGALNACHDPTLIFWTEKKRCDLFPGIECACWILATAVFNKKKYWRRVPSD